MCAILVTDDDQHIRILYKTILEKEGYRVVLAENGQQALDCIEKEKIDLIILDIKLPDIDGMELLSKIVLKSAHPPVLISSAYPEYCEDGRSWIAEDFIVKSSDFMYLLVKVKEILIRKAKTA